MGFTKGDKKTKRMSSSSFLADENQNLMKKEKDLSQEVAKIEDDKNFKNLNLLENNSTDEEASDNNKKSTTISTQKGQPTVCDNHKWRLHWPMIAFMTYMHVHALIGLILGVTHAHIATLVWFFILIQFGATGIICGAHRLWTHRAYKAGLPFRIFLMLCNTLALQVSNF